MGVGGLRGVLGARAMVREQEAKAAAAEQEAAAVPRAAEPAPEPSKAERAEGPAAQRAERLALAERFPAWLALLCSQLAHWHKPF